MVKQTAGRDQLGDFAPKFAQLNDLLSAKNNGITKEEIAEILTHAAFYAGWLGRCSPRMGGGWDICSVCRPPYIELEMA